MKFQLKPIKVIAMFDTEKNIVPLKFKIEDIQEIIKIDHSLLLEIKKFGGEELYIFKCQGKLEGEDRLFEIAYNKDKVCWTLRKMKNISISVELYKTLDRLSCNKKFFIK